MSLISRRHARGFSLIEVMVAGTIGLLLMAATSQIFLSNKQSFTAQEAMGNIQENARLAMFFLQRDIRIAGFPKDSGVPAFVVGACPGVSTCTFGATPNADNPSPTLTGAQTCAIAAGSFDCGTGHSDQIEVVMQGTVDCLGRTTPGPNVANRYFVRIDPLTRVRRLMCASVLGEQPLVEGIESLQFLYGVDLTLPLDSPTHYVRADQVTAGGNWFNVVSVRVGVLASSVANADGPPAAQRYLLLDAPFFTRTDSLRRRTFVSTIEIRNRVP